MRDIGQLQIRKSKEKNTYILIKGVFCNNFKIRFRMKLSDRKLRFFTVVFEHYLIIEHLLYDHKSLELEF